MPSTFRNSFWAGLLVAFVLGVYLLRLWSPENQVRLHSEHLVLQVERRNWSAVENFVAADYHDAWEDDRARLLNRLQLVGRFFFDLTITVSGRAYPNDRDNRNLAGPRASHRRRRSRRRDHYRSEQPNDAFQTSLASRELAPVGLAAGAGDERIAQRAAGRVLSPHWLTAPNESGPYFPSACRSSFRADSTSPVLWWQSTIPRNFSPW